MTSLDCHAPALSNGRRKPAKHNNRTGLHVRLVAVGLFCFAACALWALAQGGWDAGALDGLPRRRMQPHSAASDVAELLKIMPELAGIGKSAGSRPISIKVGVFVAEQRPADELFIEFDPTVEPVHTDNQIILPYVAAPFAAEELPFYLLVFRDCSSTLLPSDLVTDPSQYSLAACEDALARLPSSQWKAVDRVFPDAAQYRSTFPQSANACFACQAVANVTGVRRFRAISLSSVVQLLPRVELLDIDAQGLDVALLLSLGRLVTRVRQVKIECQVGDKFLYGNVLAGQRVPANNCTVAEEFLGQHGFSCRKEIKNCACGEFNLFCDAARE